MTPTKQDAQILYQQLQAKFDKFWYQNKQDETNYLAGEIATVCREAAEKIKSLVNHYENVDNLPQNT